MRKIFCKLIPILILITSANADEIFLKCESFKSIAHRTNGKIEVDTGYPLKEMFKINSAKRKVFTFIDSVNMFVDVREDIKWKEEVITWESYLPKLSVSDNFSASTRKYKINRLTLDYEISTVYDNDKHFKKIDEFYKCDIIDKKF